jgi:hypothetical protein
MLRQVYRCLLAALSVCAAFGQVKLDFVTQLKGSDADVVRSVAVDRDGNIIVAGTTRSPDLATSGVVQPERASSNLFRLNGQGKLAGIVMPSTTRLLTVTPDPRAADAWLVSDVTGLYRTSDAGSTWQRIGDGIPASETVLSLAFSPGQPGVVYAGAGKRVYRSTNGGQTFVPISPELVPNEMYYGASEIAIDPFSPSTLFVFAIRKSFRTHDGGSTWQEVAIPVRKVEFDDLRRGTIYGLYGSQAVASNDGGATWKPLAAGGGDARVILPDPKVAGRVYLGTNITLGSPMMAAAPGATQSSTAPAT